MFLDRLATTREPPVACRALKTDTGRMPAGHAWRADMLKDIHSPGLAADPEDGGTGTCCAGCGRSIDDRFYLSAVDMCWHVGCLQCAECKLPLDAELTCYSRHGNIYCKQDYYRYLENITRIFFLNFLFSTHSVV